MSYVCINQEESHYTTSVDIINTFKIQHITRILFETIVKVFHLQVYIYNFFFVESLLKSDKIKETY